MTAAKLSAGLLARKGEARPAMRSDLDAGAALGWNDMGAAPLPAVLQERAALSQQLAVPKPSARVLATAKQIQRETAHQGKAAFTLRLDSERHLKLRLAVALRGGSAQQFVTEAVDAFLTNLPEVEALVAQLPPRPNR